MSLDACAKQKWMVGHARRMSFLATTGSSQAVGAVVDHHATTKMTFPWFLVIFCCSLSISQAQTNFSGSTFPCVVTNPGGYTADNVHRLRPSDLRVIASLGDSLTAGYRALESLDQIDYRGLSWSGGKSTHLVERNSAHLVIRK